MFPKQTNDFKLIESAGRHRKKPFLNQIAESRMSNFFVDKLYDWSVRKATKSFTLKFMDLGNQDVWCYEDLDYCVSELSDYHAKKAAVKAVYLCLSLVLSLVSFWINILPLGLICSVTAVVAYHGMTHHVLMNAVLGGNQMLARMLNKSCQYDNDAVLAVKEL